MQKEYLSLLFNPGESFNACRKLYDVDTLYSLSDDVPEIAQYLCINPLSGSRRDSNVNAFRNILIELDSGSLTQQANQINESGVPHSAVVYSGGKSLHVIISLDNSIANDEYRALVKHIYRAFPNCDKTCGNPSRLTRLGGAIRDNGVRQDIMHIGKRVSLDQVERWLESKGIGKESIENVNTGQYSASDGLSPAALSLLEFGAREGSRNRRIYLTALELKNLGKSKDETLQLLRKAAAKSNYLKEYRRPVESAYRSN